MQRPAGVDEPWAVLTDLPPTLQILSHYASRFCIEHLFRDNKSGEFDLEACRIRDRTASQRLYLVIAIATVYATLQGLDVQQQQQQRPSIDIHWDRGLSFLKIGLRWIRGAVYQGWQLLAHWRCSLHIHLLLLAVPAVKLKTASLPSSSTGFSASPQDETRVLSVSEA